MRSKTPQSKRHNARDLGLSRSRRGTFAALASTAALTFMGMIPAVAVAADTGGAPDAVDSLSQAEGALPPELVDALDSQPQLSAAVVPQSGDQGKAKAATTGDSSQSDTGDKPPADTGDTPPADTGGDGDDSAISDPDLDEDPQSEEPQSGAKSSSRVGITPLALGDAEVVVRASTNGQPPAVNSTYYGANTALTVGAKYELRTTATDASTAVPGASCEIVAATPGTCTITVASEHANKSYYLVQTQAATGTYFTSRMNLNNPYTPDLHVSYPGLTPNLETNKTVEMPKDQVAQGSSYIAMDVKKSFGSAVNSINNPVVGARCTAGLKIAFMLDVSGSMNENAGSTTRLGLLKSAFTQTGGILDSLADTNNQIALFNFSSNSAGTGTSTWNRPTPVSVTSGPGGNLAGLKAAVGALSANGFTNWDQALRVVSKANETHDYDVLVFVTDGAPNYILTGGFANNTFNSSGGTEVSGSQVTQRSVEAAIYSANSLKAQGTRIVSYGIYQGTTGAYAAQDNLAAVSGPNKGSDYFVADVNALTEYLASLVASLTCSVPITVEKYVPGATTGSWVGKAAWPMSVTNTGGVGALAQPTSSTTNASGVAGPWNLQFTEGADTTSLTVAETAQTGWQQAKAPEYVISNIVQGTGPTTLPLPDGGVIPGVQPGDSITVKFYNEEITTPSVVKNFVSSNQVSGNPDQWRVIYSVEVTGANVAQDYQLVDNPGFPSQVEIVSGNAHRLEDLSGHVIIGEDFDIEAGEPFPNPAANLPKNGKHYYHVEWVVKLTGDVTDVQQCSPNGAGNGFFNEVLLQVGGQTVDQDDACGPIDKAVIPSVEKSVTGTPTQGADGKWTVNYQVKVTLPTSTADNPDKHNASYNLVDTLNFGGGIEVASGDATWMGPGSTSGTFTGNTATLATAKQIEFTSPVHTYNIKVITSINPLQIVENTTACPAPNGDGNGGFMNRVVLTSSGVERKAEACDVPVLNAPTVLKTAAASTRNADGSWKITYNVAVTNSSAADLYYTLNDTPADPPDGATWKSGGDWAVSGPSEGGASGSATINPDWNGSTDKKLATGQVTAGKTQTFTLTRDLVLSPTMDLSTLECKQDSDESSGVWNSAVVTNGVTSNGPSKACAEILTPRLTVDKTVASVTQSAQNTWVVTYDVVVQNRGTTGATFGIEDVPNFGAGFTVTEGKWVGAVQPLPGPNANYINAGSEYDTTYHYEVTATFDPATQNPGLTCVAEGGAGAFMNQVNVTSSSGDVSDWACAEPAGPTIEKVALAPVQDPATGEWRIGYDLVVTAPTATEAPKLAEVRYTLSDVAAALPAGVTGGTWTVVAPTLAAGDGTFVSSSPAWDGSGTVGTGTIPVGKQHTVKVFRNVTVGTSAVPTDLVCSQAAGGTGIWNQGTVTNGVKTTSDDACATVTLPTLTLEKTIGTVTQLSDGQWVIPYTVTVKNTSAVVGKYDLADTLKFGAGIVVYSATWTGPSSSSGTFTLPAGTAQLATGTVIGANLTHTYTVEVKATIGATIWENPGPVLTCPSDGDDHGAFLNSAALTYPKGTITKEACGEPSLPTIQKTAAGVTQDATDPDKWTVNYTVTVKGGANDTFYDLSDTPSFAPGVTVESGTASGPGTAGSAVAITSGVKFVTAHPLPAGATHVYLVSFDVTIASPIVGEAAKCGEVPTEGKGFFNRATLTSGGVEQDGETCAPITELVRPAVSKTVSSTVQNADGTWSVTYGVTVTLPKDEASNPKGLSAKYDLADTLRFGEGVEVSGATWSGESSGSFSKVGDVWSGSLASGVTITPANNVHTYAVVAKAAVTNVAFEGGNADCVIVEGEDGTGFLNRAALTSGGTTDQVEACSSPAKPTMTKVAQDARFDEVSGLWTVGYLLTVTNASALPLQFTLGDAPAALPTGLSLDGGVWRVAAQGSTPPVGDANATWSPSSSDPWTIAAGTISAEGTYKYLVSGKVRISPASAVPGAGCEPGGGAAFGLANLADISSGGTSNQDDSCVDIPATDLTVTKTVDGAPTQDPATGEWTVNYKVVVQNTTSTPGLYNLSDDILFDGESIVVDSASWSGEGATGPFAEDSDGVWTATMAAGKAIVGDATHEYSVTVLATVAPGAWDEAPDALRCEPEDGEGRGGFLNRANLTRNGETVFDEDCAEPARPSIFKEFRSATQSEEDPTLWSVAYTVTVDGSASASDLYYDLFDTPNFADGVVNEGGTATRSGVPAVTLGATGGQIADGTLLPAGESHVYTVIYRATISAPIVGEDARCGEVSEPGQGFFNAALLVSGGSEQESWTCGPIDELVRPSVEKTAVSRAQDDDGNWTINYEVKVTLPLEGELNPKGLSAKYDLVDTLAYGAGIDVNAASWNGASSGSFVEADGDWSGALASGKAIKPVEGQNVHTYYVTVNAGVPTEVFTSGAADCERGEDESGTGFLNRVAMTSGGSTDVREACAAPAAPSATKDGQAPIQEGDGTWTVNYLVTVKNPSDLELLFALTDSPADFPRGVTLTPGTTWTVEALQEMPDGTTVVPVKPPTGDWVFASGRIAPDVEFKFLVSANLTINVREVEGVPLPEVCETIGVGIPLTNQLGLVSGEFESYDPSCVAVPDPATWELEKSASPTSGSTVQPGSTVTYTLKVTNTGKINLFDAVVVDDLSKVLNNATLVTPLPEGLTLNADGKTLAWDVPRVDVGKSATVSYQVVVNKDAWKVQIKNVATPDTPGGTCVVDKCSTEHDTPQQPAGPTPTTPSRPPLARTGAAVGGVLIAAALAGGLGFLLVRRSRRDL